MVKVDAAPWPGREMGFEGEGIFLKLAVIHQGEVDRKPLLYASGPALERLSGLLG